VRPGRAVTGPEEAGVLMLDSGRKVLIDYTQVGVGPRRGERAAGL
jgi:hypothetical protein